MKYDAVKAISPPPSNATYCRTEAGFCFMARREELNDFEVRLKEKSIQESGLYSS